MAELIDKGALYDAMTEEYKKHYAGTGKGYDFTIAMQMVQNQPTTTEADIRARAIDEFAEFLHRKAKENNGLRLSSETRSWTHACIYDYVKEFEAEQLKGE